MRTSPHIKSAAFFDVDDTLMSGISIASFFGFAIEQLEDPAFAARLREFERVAPTYADRVSMTIDFFKLLAGLPWSQMLSLGEAWYASAGRARLIPELVDRVRAHRDRGDLIVLVSGSWPPCVLPLARQLGADEVFCCEMGVEADTLTGEVSLIPLAETKAHLVREFALQHDLDLTHCTAYGDDESDIPMLAAVGRPVATNPSPALTEIARARGWEVLRLEPPTSEAASRPA